MTRRGRSRVEREAGALATAAVQRIDAEHAWYRDLTAEERSYVGLVAQSGITSFVDWYRHAENRPQVTGSFFEAAPRELTRSVSLAQTLELVRTVIGVVEDHVAHLAEPGEERELREAVLVYSRDVAFAAAMLYAEAAESRGAWDARLESLVVGSVLRGEADTALQSRASALGWESVSAVSVLVGPASAGSAADVVEAVRTAARHAQVQVLASVQGRRLVVVLGEVAVPREAAVALEQEFGPGTIVTGPVVPHLFAAGRSARAASSGYECSPGWLQAPRVVDAEELLPERALAGDVHAQRTLAARVAAVLTEAGGAYLETATTYLEGGGSLEGSARELFVHPNTVRYRLGRIADLTGYDLTDARDAFAARLGLALARLRASRTAL